MRTHMAALIALCTLGACASPRVADLQQGQTGWISFPTIEQRLNPGPNEQFYSLGELVLPDGAGARVPAVIVAHASGGVDNRSERWARFLRDQGFATFKLDYFSPRGIDRHSAHQPEPVEDVFAALRLLATHPRIDPARIGVIGFSRGANMALTAAGIHWERYAGGNRFAAHVALYPTCWRFADLEARPRTPILVLIGSKDDLASADQCQQVVDQIRSKGPDASVKIYQGAYHGWDGDTTGVWYHRAINRSYEMRADLAVTRQSRQDVLEFLKRALNP
jgi:dienelactone hydrolase